MEEKIYTVEEFQENFDELLDRVIEGEHLKICSGDNVCVMVPADDEIIRMYLNHNEAS